MGPVIVLSLSEDFCEHPTTLWASGNLYLELLTNKLKNSRTRINSFLLSVMRNDVVSSLNRRE